MDNQLNLQFHSLSKNLKRGDISVPDFGELVSASVILHDYTACRVELHE